MFCGDWLIQDSFNVTPEELFDLFGKFGPVRYVAFSTLHISTMGTMLIP